MLSDSRSFLSASIAPVTLLLLIWLLAIALIDPVGEFPLNDDWSYALAVKALVEDGVLRFTGWVSMPLIVQVYWGAAFAAIDGFSFTALRLSTLTMGCVAIVATFWLLRLVGATPWLGFFGALLLLANPLFMSLSHSFMTDVPFTALFVLATCLLLIGMRRDAAALICGGLLVALLAVFIRQLGLALFIGFAVGWVARHGFSGRSIALAAAPLLVAVALYIGYGEWLTATERMPRLYAAKADSLLTELATLGALKTLVFNGLKMLVYGGIFMLPLLVLLGRANAAPGRYLIATGVTLTLLCVGLLTTSGALFPPSGNILFPGSCGMPQLALGPLTLPYLEQSCAPVAPVITPWAQLILLLLGAGGGIVSVFWLLRSCAPYNLAASREFLQRNWERLLLLAALGAYLAPALLASFVFDRYLLPVLPLALALVLATAVAAPGRLQTAAAGGLLGSMLLFSLIATHDHMAWNRARWDALTYLEQELAVTSQQIDGGFEYNGLRNYSDDYVEVPDKNWWVIDDAYSVAAAPRDNYVTLRELPVDSWMPGGLQSILVLQRTP